MAPKKAPAKKKSAAKKAATTKAAPRQKKMPVPPPKKKTGKNSKKSRSQKNKSMLFSVLAAASMGYLEATGMDKKIPQVETLGASGTLAAVALGYGLYAKNETAQDVGLGYAAISAYKLGFGFGVPAAPKSEPTATKGDFADVSAIPAGACLPNGMPVVGVDPRLLSEAASTLEELSGDDEDDDDVSGDDEDDVSGYGDEDDSDVSGDDEDDDE